MAEQPSTHPVSQPTDGRALYGVAGWAYDDWNGIVYPKPRPRGFHPLKHLMRFFDTVEINSSFYAIPAPQTSEKWARMGSDAPGFEFTMKLFQGFTHVRQDWDERSAREFVAAAQPLSDAGVLGSILVQFPWSFKPDPASRAVLERILDRFSKFPLTVEVRHRGWVEDSADYGIDLPEMLRARGVAFCNIDQPHLHDCIGLTEIVTAPHAYLRVHGRNYKSWFAEMDDRNARYDYFYTPGEVSELAEAVKELKSKAKKVYVITNNHWRGQAAANALQIRAEAENTTTYAPEEILRHYGDLGPRVIAEKKATEQMELF